jgi:tetratricopeptide (TPR) repeat protein
LGDRRTRAWALQFTSAFYGAKGNWEQARDDAGESASLHKELGDQRYSNQTLIVKALCFLMLGSFDQALELLDVIEPIAERHQDVQMLLWVILSKLEIYFTTQEIDVPPLIDKVHSLLLQNPMLIDQMWGYGSLAWTYMKINEYDLAKEYADKALDLMTQTRPFAWHSYHGYANTAATYLELWESGAYPMVKESTSKAIKALAGFAKIFSFVAAQAQLCQSHYCRLSGNTKKGRKESLKALENARRLKMRYVEGTAHFTLGKYFSSDDPERRMHLEQALEIFTDLGAKKDLELTQQALAQK